jgi:hypothetical protein
MKVKSLVLAFLAAGLLVGAPQAMAQSFSDSFVVDVDSASGVVAVDSEFCMAAVLELTVDDGYVLQDSSPLGGSGGPDLTTYLFTGETREGRDGYNGPDVVTLYCIADIDIDIGGGGGPDGDGGMGLGMCGGLGMGC